MKMNKLDWIVIENLEYKQAAMIVLSIHDYDSTFPVTVETHFTRDLFAKNTYDVVYHAKNDHTTETLNWLKCIELSEMSK
jgi:hypothetical protein